MSGVTGKDSPRCFDDDDDDDTRSIYATDVVATFHSM